MGGERRGAGGLEASLGRRERASGAREGEGATIRESLPQARTEGESEGRGALWLCSSGTLEAKQDGEAREARSGSGIEHPEIVCIAVDALQESLTALRIAKEERGGERRGLREEDRHSHREAMGGRINCTRGGALLISREGGGYVHASFASGEEASSTEQRRLRVVIKREEGDRAERLRDGTDARGDGSVEQIREASGLLL